MPPQSSKEPTEAEIPSNPEAQLFKWFQSPWIPKVLFVAALLICYGISVNVRYHQLNTWQQNPQQFFVGEQPLMTTLDAPYYVGMAKNYYEGEFYNSNYLLDYPKNEIWYRQSQANLSSAETGESNIVVKELEKQTFPTAVPLLSFLVAMLAPFFAGNVYLAGHWLVISLAGLFIIPLGIYGWRIGYPIAGLLGGLIGTFCSEYFVRSSTGRIDTDMLNIFWPVLTGVFILLTCSTHKTKFALIWSALAGLSMNLFMWWYSQAGFLILYLFALLLVLVVHKHSAKLTLLSSITFIFFSGPRNMLNGFSSLAGFLGGGYFQLGEVDADAIQAKVGVTYPNVGNTISETARVPMTEVLQQVLSNPIWGWIGLVVFALFVIRYWPKMIPLLPIFALGLLGFQTSRRFIMYLGPFIGFGLGVLITITIRLIWNWICTNFEPDDPKEKSSHLLWSNSALIGNVLLYVGLFGSWAFFAPQTAVSYVPGPSIPPPVYQTFEQVKRLVPKNGVVYSWWDYGYAISDATNRKTFMDGGNHSDARLYFIARSFISSEQEELRRIIGFVSNFTNSGIKRLNTGKDELLREVYSGKYRPHDPIYVFYTYDMIGKFSALYYLGSWNFDTLRSDLKGYQRLQCSKLENQVLTCQGVTIDLKQGLVNGQIPLRRLVQSIQGRETKIQELKEQGFSLQLMMPNERQFSEIYLMEEAVWASNFNQMYLLGNYDKEVFEEVFHAFPIARLFRLKDLEPLE